VSERTAVYRVYGDTDDLLYVGVAKSFGRRWSQHSSAKPWWAEVRRQTVDWFPTRQAALNAEATAIRDERPRYNTVAALLPNGLAQVGKTPNRPIRIEPALWEEFGALVGTRRRSSLIREFIFWYLRYPGAKLPERPDSGP
jgi:predicted GIY-YIG superfamily endonuclease